MTERIDTSRVIRGLMRRWMLILLITIQGAVIGYGVSQIVTPVYRGTSSVIVGQPLEAPNLNKDQVEASYLLAHTYADIARRQPVLNAVVEELGLKTSWTELRENVRLDVPPNNAQLIAITAQATSPDLARRIAREVSEQLIGLRPESPEAPDEDVQGFVSGRLDVLQKEIQQTQMRLDRLENALGVTINDARARQLQGQLARQQQLLLRLQQTYSSLHDVLATGEPSNDLQILETAEASTTPVIPDVQFNTVLAGAIAFFLGLGLAYVLEFRGEEPMESTVELGGMEASRGAGQSEDGAQLARPKGFPSAEPASGGVEQGAEDAGLEVAGPRQSGVSR